MPYLFVEIEKRKTGVIKALFAFLIVFYVIIVELAWVVVKLSFSSVPPKPGIGFFSQEPYLISFEDVILVFIIASAIAYIHWLFSVSNLKENMIGILNARTPDPNDSYHKLFQDVVEEVSVATGGRKMQPYIVPTSGLNAFAISDFKGNSVIGITEGLLAKLNRSQLEAVVGHEAAHVVSNDSLTSSVACALFGIQLAFLEILRVSLRNSRGSATLYFTLLYLVLSISRFINLFINMFISRQKEYRADAAAVRLTRNPIALAEALYIISRGWRGVGVIPQSLAPLFITNPDYNHLAESEGFIPDLLSTHPPMKSRLAVLLSMAHSSMASLAGAESRTRIPVEQDIVDVNEELKDGANPIEAECPTCHMPLNEVLYEGAPVYKCRHCEGVLIGGDIVPRVLLREEIEIPEQAKKMANIALDEYTKNAKDDRIIKVAYELSCPKCRNKMRRAFYSYAYPIQVDRCDGCGQVWFDKGELEMLQYLSEKDAQRRL